MKWNLAVVNFCTGIYLNPSIFVRHVPIMNKSPPPSGVFKGRNLAVDHSDSSLGLHFFWSYISFFTGWDEGVLGMQLGEVARLTVNGFSFLLILSWGKINHGVSYPCYEVYTSIELRVYSQKTKRQLEKKELDISLVIFTLLSFDLFSLH